MTTTEQDLKIRACRLRFWERFNETAKTAGGGNAAALLALPFGEVVKQLAHNGFVFTYDHTNTVEYVPNSYVIQAAVGRINELESRVQ